MEITETNQEGLKREFTITLAPEEIDQRLNERLKDISQNIRMKGFRPGKVPMNLVKKLHGEAVMGEVLEKAVDETAKEAMSEKDIRPATQPQIEVKDYGEGKGLEYTMAVEILPDIELGDLSRIAVERPVAEIGDKDIDEFLNRLAERQKNFTAAPEGKAAAEGDAVVIDFTGYVDGEAFEGGSAEDFEIELGSGRFIPGFEEQLIGGKSGDQKNVTVNFPEDYQAEELAGKEAIFEVTVKAVKVPEPVEVNDEFAQKLGLTDLNELKEKAREQLEKELGDLSRMRVKRRILDILADEYAFDVPPGMVDSEFDQIWHEYQHELEREGRSIEDEAESEEDLKAEYRAIAERRVRLGLLLSEIGQANNIEVTNEELNRLLAEEARRYPGQEQQVINFYRENPQAMAQLRAPYYEDKVVDFILELAHVTDKKVSREELEQEPDEEAAAQPEPEKKSQKKGASSKKSASTKKSGGAKTSGSKKSTQAKADTAASGEGAAKKSKSGGAAKGKSSSAAKSKSGGSSSQSAAAKKGTSTGSASGQSKKSGASKNKQGGTAAKAEKKE